MRLFSASNLTAAADLELIPEHNGAASGVEAKGGTDRTVKPRRGWLGLFR